MFDQRIFTVSREDLMDALESDFLGRFPGGSIQFTDNEPVGKGMHVNGDVRIGFGDCVDDFDMFSLIRSVFHEGRHLEQERTNFSCCGDLASACRIDDLACSGSRMYYGAGIPGFDRPLSHYWHNIREIDAERFGVSRTVDYLYLYPEFVGGRDAEDVVLGFVNEKYLRKDKDAFRSYFVDFSEPFLSLDNFETMCDRQMHDAVFMKAEAYRIGNDADSCVGIMLRQNGLCWDEAVIRLGDAKDGSVERHIVAGVVRAAHPEYTKNLSAADRKSISAWKTFGTLRFPKISSDVEERLKLLPESERRKSYLDAVDMLPDPEDNSVSDDDFSLDVP